MTPTVAHWPSAPYEEAEIVVDCDEDNEEEANAIVVPGNPDEEMAVVATTVTPASNNDFPPPAMIAHATVLSVAQTNASPPQQQPEESIRVDGVPIVSQRTAAVETRSVSSTTGGTKTETKKRKQSITRLICAMLVILPLFIVLGVSLSNSNQKNDFSTSPPTPPPTPAPTGAPTVDCNPGNCPEDEHCRCFFSGLYYDPTPGCYCRDFDDSRWFLQESCEDYPPCSDGNFCPTRQACQCMCHGSLSMALSEEYNWSRYSGRCTCDN